MIAYILAGEKGPRLEPWHAPKCLMPLGGIPLLHRIIRHVSSTICCDSTICVCVGYKADDVKASVASWLGPTDQTIRFSDAGEDATMCERLTRARAEWGTGHADKPSLVLYGDDCADVDLDELFKDHKRSKAFMTMTVHEERLPFGIYREGKIVDGLPVKVNIGFAVVEPQAWKYAEGCSGLSDFFNKLTWCVDGQSSVNVYEHMGRRATINNPSDIAKAEAEFK